MERRRSPFPGMDPYLEDPAVWAGFHDSLLTYLKDDLQAALPEAYYADLRDRVYVEQTGRWFEPDVRITRTDGPKVRAPAGPALPSKAATAVVIEEPAIEVREPYLEICDARTGHRVVTVIELLSPANKRPGSGRVELYRAKQLEALSSDAGLVEIDLLRTGLHVVAVTRERLEPYRPFDYLVVVCRAEAKERREVYPMRLRTCLPRVKVPLCAPEPDVEVDLQSLAERAYDGGAYWKRLDYERPPAVPLSAEDEAWAREVVAASRRP